MQLTYYKCLLRRLPTSHLLYTNCLEELKRIEAGLSGEERVLRELLDLSGNYIWLSNYQCYSPQKTTHQIDFIILCPHFTVVLEVKNISGTVSYQTVGKEFIRTRPDGQTEIFRNPFDQAFRHQQLLEQLFDMWKIELPITHAVIMTNSNTHICPSFGNLPIFHVTHLRKYLSDLKKHYPIHRLNLNLLKRKLEDYACILPPRQKVSPSEISPGILCSSCLNEMTYNNGVSICKSCGKQSRSALLETLRDYYFLVDRTISNRELREFAKLNSRHQAAKILSRLSLEKIGNTRSIRYLLPETLSEIPF